MITAYHCWLSNSNSVICKKLDSAKAWVERQFTDEIKREWMFVAQTHIYVSVEKGYTAPHGVIRELEVIETSYNLIEVDCSKLDLPDRLHNYGTKIYESIQVNGIFNPIIVAHNKKDRFLVVDGVARVLACNSLGIKTIKCQVMEW